MGSGGRGLGGRRRRIREFGTGRQLMGLMIRLLGLHVLFPFWSGYQWWFVL